MATARQHAATARHREAEVRNRRARNTAMSVQFYQDMIDRGWRRSGDFMYRPDMARTCCPQYTIRLDALAFKPNKKHRQVINRWNRYLATGEKPGEGSGSGGGEGNAGKGKGKQKGKGTDEAGWLDVLREWEVGSGMKPEGSAKHRFETEFTPAKATAETFELYRKYQVAVHKDPYSKVTMRGFQRFLCDSPLGGGRIPYSGDRLTSLPEQYGSYHLLYKVDGKIVGISVVDILPSCVSSVYFIWDPDYAWASLGKLSALFEIAIAMEMYKAGVEGMRWLYMGYWIANCVKMRYKSEYSPSYLLDPGTSDFHLLTAKLDSFLQSHPKGYFPFIDIEASFSDPADLVTGSLNDGAADMDPEMDDVDSLETFPHPPPPGFADPLALDEGDLESMLVMMKGGRLRKSRVVPLGALQFADQEGVMELIRELVAAVGQEYMAHGDSSDGMRDKGILMFG